MKEKKSIIRNFKQRELKSNKDKNKNKKLLNQKKKKERRLGKKLVRNSKAKKYELEKGGEISRKKRVKIALIIFSLAFLALIFRIAWIDFVNGEELSQMAYLQQTLERKISPRRGTIYDATGKVTLATSSSVETITVNPLNIEKEDKEKIANKLCDLFELDYETVIKKLNKKTAIETIIRKVDKEKTDILRIWLEENNIKSGVNIDEDTKRFYPYNNLASQIIGFCGSDNQGLSGIEAIYDDELKGESGSILKMTDAKGINIENTSESYESAIDGNDLVLTIDATIQGIAEKYLSEACIDNMCTDGGNVIVMNPKNGDVLAIASYPDFNLNEPFTINNEEKKAVWDTLSSTEKNNELNAMWRNKAISDTYEPGSTFKLVTASTALDTGIVTDIDKQGEFSCIGYIEIAGVKMKCWRYYKPHGAESLRQALMNSCNPVFIGLGQKIGKQKYYEYLNKFGFLKKTGIDLPGEASSIFLKEEKVGPVELGTIAFGQRFEVTPIQMATMVSTIANGGKYVKPRIVKEIINSQNGEVTEIEPEYGEQVISSENASKVLSMMESVVAEGTGKNAQVQGYSVGGKTGTSEDGVNTGKYVASFVGVAPIEDPCIVILVTLYNPTGEGGHGGGAWVILTTHILINCKWKGFDNLSIRKEMKVDEVIVYMEYTQNGKSLEECILKILKQKVSYGGRVIKCQEESQNIN